MIKTSTEHGWRPRHAFRVRSNRMRAAVAYTLLCLCLVTLQLLPAFAANRDDADAQELLNKQVTIELDHQPLERLFKEITRQTGLQFNYLKQTVSVYDDVTVPYGKRTVKETLDMVFKEMPLGYETSKGGVVIFRKERDAEKAEASLETTPAYPIRQTTETLTSLNMVTVQGRVTDAANGEPLAGVNILEMGTSRGTTTDVEGFYVMDIPGDAILVFSFIGFKTMEIPVNGRSTVDITMEADVEALEEVVVNAGYYKVKDRESTGNIVKVDAKDIAKQPVTNPLQALQGRTAGVFIQQNTGVAGGGFSIQIRGQNSLRSGFGGEVNGNYPLYVVNGVPITSDPLAQYGDDILAGGSPLSSINPYDIESIEILKDADATAIYGSRGANGVVLITTKQGQKGKMKVTVDLSQGFSEVGRKLDLLNTEQYIDMRNEAFVNDESTPGGGDFDVNGTWDTERYTDWQEVLLGGTGRTTNGRISLSGGSDDTQFLLSLGYYGQNTVFSDRHAYTKLPANISINHVPVNGRFSFNFSLNYVVEQNELPFRDRTQRALTLAPNAPALYDDEGNLNWENGTWENPVAVFLHDYRALTNTLNSNVQLQFELFEGLSLKTRLGYNDTDLKETLEVPLESLDPFGGATTASSTFIDNAVTTWIIEPQLDYEYKLGPGVLKALVGMTFQESDRSNQVLKAEGYTNDALLSNPLGGTTSYVSSFRTSQYRYNAVYGRLNYNWRETYVVNLTARRDGSSRFGPGRQFGNFGAVGAAWIFTNEPFLNRHPVISFGKLRASYGTTGSDQIGDYGYIDLWDPTNLPYGGTTGLLPRNLFNAKFGWEVNKKLEFGLELGLWHDKLFATVSHYRNRSDNQLVGFPLSRVTGFPSIQSNFPALVENTGWEFSLNVTPIDHGHFSWSSNINLTLPRNELLKFPDIENTVYVNRYQVGDPLFVQYGYHWQGVDPDTGEHTVEDLNADERISISDDRKFLGTIAQDYFGGIENTIRYRNVTLSFLFQIVKQTNRSYVSSFGSPGSFSNQPVEVLKRWTTPGDVTNVQKFTQGGAARGAYGLAQGSNYAFGDASFVRLKNVHLSYSLSGEFLKRLRLSQCRVYAQAQNLLTFTDYKGLDPETLNSSLPPLRTINFGVQLSF